MPEMAMWRWSWRQSGRRVNRAADAHQGLRPVAHIDADALRRQVKRWRPWVVMLMAGWFEMRYQQSRDKQFIALADDAWRQLQTKG
jgi:thiamine kinase